MTYKRPIVIIAGVCVILLAAFPLSLAGLFPWSGLNCWTTEIDVYSGRSRFTRYLYWIPIKRSFLDTALTKEFTPEDLSGLPSEWHPVYTGSPRIHHSPHHVYHGALSQIRDLEDFWKRTGANEELRRSNTIQFLRLWQKGVARDAQQFLDKIQEDASTNEIPDSMKVPAND
jgi:hypothetical protein